LHGDARDAVTRISEEMLGDPNPALHSEYSRAVYPAWFADSEMASRFTPPTAISETGAAVLARLRHEGYDWRPRLRAFSIETLVIHGELDPLPRTIFPDASYNLSNARYVAVPSSGHMPFWEAPERFFAVVESFLS